MVGGQGQQLVVCQEERNAAETRTSARLLTSGQPAKCNDGLQRLQRFVDTIVSHRKRPKNAPAYVLAPARLLLRPAARAACMHRACTSGRDTGGRAHGAELDPSRPWPRVRPRRAER